MSPFYLLSSDLQSDEGTVLGFEHPGAWAGLPLGCCPGGFPFSDMVVRLPPTALGDVIDGDTSPHDVTNTAANTRIDARFISSSLTVQKKRGGTGRFTQCRLLSSGGRTFTEPSFPRFHAPILCLKPGSGVNPHLIC